MDVGVRDCVFGCGRVWLWLWVCVVVAVGMGGNCIDWLSCCVAVRGMQKMHFRREGVAEMKKQQRHRGPEAQTNVNATMARIEFSIC